jgi:hypothetical protein
MQVLTTTIRIRCMRCSASQLRVKVGAGASSGNEGAAAVAGGSRENNNLEVNTGKRRQ